MKKDAQIVQASILGTKAFKDGLEIAPFLNKDLMDMLDYRKVGITPEGEASSVEIMKAYTDSWISAHIVETDQVLKSN